ncbi:MAG: protein kinase [Byssovorax sp.]
MLKPGDTFERYTIDGLLGHGGMGQVYKAHDTRLERRVALKIISEDSASPESNARLLREAKAAAALDHPNAVSIFDVGDAEGTPYIVMELVPGETLRAGIGVGTIDLATRLAWLTDVARALAAAHKKGLVHRDIKPENVMIREDGLVKVLDFGIARRAAGSVDPGAATQSPALATLTVKGDRLGTPLYMAPEQIKGDNLDGRADQFAWGVMAFELLTGTLPWRGGVDALAVVASILTDDPPEERLDGAKVPAPVKAAVLRALEKKPAARFPSMDALLAALEGKEAPASDAPKVLDPATPPAKAAPAKAAPASAVPAKAAPPASATTAQRYSTADVRAILERAVEKQELEKQQGGRLGFDDLLAAAAEVGVGADVLREASRELRQKVEDDSLVEDEQRDRDAWFRRKRRGFYRHFGIYVIVSVAFALFGLITDGVIPMLIPSLFWGIGVAIHGLTALTASEDDWADHRDKKRRLDLKRKRREEKHEKVSRAIEEGAALLLDTGRTLRRRIAEVSAASAAAPPPAGPRVRVARDPRDARDTDRIAREAAEEAAAEAAAEAEERASRRRERRDRR